MEAPETNRWLGTVPAQKWLLPLAWAILLTGSGAGIRNACAQGSIPSLQGVYQGPGSDTLCGVTVQSPVTVSITSQVNGNFSGQLATSDGSGAPALISGTVDSTGQLQGDYHYSNGTGGGQGTFTGQFDGTVVPKTLNLTLTGTATGLGISCPETITVNAAPLAAGGASADLSITGSATPTPVATGTRITWRLTVANAGPDDATNTTVVNPAPAGTGIVAATSSQGQCVTTVGNAVCSLGAVPHGGTATITVTANLVSAVPGSTLVDSPNVSSNVFDPNLANNSTTISTAIVGGAIIKLVWDQPPPTASNPTPAPQNLRVELPGPSLTASLKDSLTTTLTTTLTTAASSTPATCSGCVSRHIGPQDSCMIISVNIYKSDSLPVLPLPANLYVVVPPANLNATLAAAPAGSFYINTNVWQCGSTIIESGVSNQASVPAGPTVTNLKVTGKLKGLGSGFMDGVQVFVNDVGFMKQATAADSTLVIQKGPLTDGTAITDLGTAGPVLVTFKNPDGGLGSFSFKRP